MTDPYAAFRYSSYRRYFASRFSTALSIQILSVAIGWQIYDETGKVALLGWIGLVQFLPALLLVVVTGLAADRLSRRAVMAVSVSVLALACLAILVMNVTGHFYPLWVLAALTVIGIGRAFYTPASTSLVVNLVAAKDFPNAIGWVTSSWQLASIIGPALGGLLYGLSASIAYGLSVGLFVFAALLIFSIPKPKQRVDKTPTDIKTLLGGFSYIWKQKIVLGAISLDLFAVLLGGAVALLPVYARDILELGPAGLGMLRAAPGIGAIAVVIYLTRFPIRDHAGAILLAAVGMFGLCTMIFGASTLSWLSIAALVAVGGFDMISVYIREVLLQIWTPDEVRGRVNAVNSIFLGASNELGEARAGFMAAQLGTVLTVVSGGLAAIGVAVGWAFLFPRLSRARFLHEGPDKDEEKTLKN